uniref:Ycf2 n=1 Tax=Heteroscyphus argutus TaxID=215262 RepID=A0A4Y5P8B0_9MARC|nr:Ycf2 [Heteroscyphus argutus]QCW59246.1 Ycf2 [Heteroscyphus argutus]
MKKKLPEKEISYKNLYLAKIRKTKIFSNLWLKCSLIRLLIAKFFDEKNIVTTFDFRTIMLSMDSHSLRKSEIFVLKNLMFFALPLSISIYCSNTVNIVERKNFGLTRVRRRDQYRKDYIGIYKKSFRSLNKNFDIFLHNIFEKKKLEKHKSIFNSITYLNDQIFFEEINCSLEEKKDESSYSSDLYKKFLDLHLFAKEIENPDHFWLRKEILQNLQNWGESSKILLKSSFLLKEKGNLDLSNYIKVFLWQFLTHNYRHWGFFRDEIFKYPYSELKNSRLCLLLENILSDAIYKISKYLICEARESDIQVKNIYFLSQETDEDVNLSDLSTIRNDVNKNLKFFNCINPNQFYNSPTYFEWIKRIPYLDDESTLKPVFIERTSLDKSFFFPSGEKTDSYFNFPAQLLMGKYIINNFFSRQETQKVNPEFFFFPGPLLINEFIQSPFFSKFNKISKNFERIYQSKNNSESDDIAIISWKFSKYHSNFLLNYLIPFNRAYNILGQNYSLDKKIRYEIEKESNRLFIAVSNFSPLSFDLKKIVSVIDCLKLKEYLVIKTNQLDILMDDQSNKIGDLSFTKKLLLISKDNRNIYNSENKLIDNYLFIQNLIHNNCYKYCSELWNNFPFRFADLGITYINNILHKYSILWKINFNKNFIYNIEDLKYNKLNLKVHNWLDKIRNSSKKIVTYQFLIKVKLAKLLKKYFRKSNSKNVDKLLHSLQISTDTYGINHQRNKVFTLVKINEFGEKGINNLIADLSLDGMNNEIMIQLLAGFPTKKNIFSPCIKNERLFFHSNYKLNFLFHSENDEVENISIIYYQFLNNYLKYNGLNRTFIKQRSIFLKKELFQLVQLKLKNFLLFSMFSNRIEKTQFVSFFHFYQKISERTNLQFPINSNRYFLKQERDQAETVATKKDIGVEGISKSFLRDLDATGIENYYNILQYESLTKNLKRNSSIFQLINKIILSPILKNSKSKNLKQKFENKILLPPDKVYGKFKKISIFDFLEKNISLRNYNYTSWFFTSEWWEHNIHIFTETLRKRFVIIGSYFEYFINNNIRLLQKNLINLHENRKNLYNLNSEWNARIFFDYTQEIILNFIWSDLQLINNWNNLSWAIFSLMTFVFLFHQNYFSILIGSDSINLWKKFENIKYLTDPSRAFYFTKLLYRNKTQLNKTENLLISFFNNLKHYTINIRFYLLTRRNLNKWLISHKSLDLSRRKRNLLVQSLITPTRIKEYGFHLYYQPKVLNNKLFGYHKNPQQGLSYLRYLSGMFKNKLVNYSVNLADKWIFFASLQKIISSQTLRRTRKFDPRFQKIPIPLQLGLSCSKGILLIGPVETGRSYLIKNLAANSSVPLFGISINKLLYNKPDIVTESWMNILIESLRRLNLTLELAKGMSPCIIWIRNIHQLDVNRTTQNIESDPTFLLGILLKHFRTDSLENGAKKNIIMIGSTHVPKKVDPSLISPDRLDRVLNIRLLNTYQRKNQFPILLDRTNFKLNKNLSYLNEFGSRTMGYNLRDLVALTNEISLISLTKNKSFVYDDIIKLAFHRQILGFSHTNDKPNYKQNFKILLYKIGRAIIQYVMMEGSVINPLNIRNYLWKKNFYYLSKWYSEPSMDDSIIKESTILVHILVCLAGIAARDSWFPLEKNSDISISLDKSVENDLDLAFSLLETFSTDFPWLETCKTKSISYERKNSKIFFVKNILDIMHNGIFAITNESIINNQNESHYDSFLSGNKIINRKIYEFNNTAWSPRSWRLSFSRSHLFNWIKRPNDFEFFHTFGFPKENSLEKKNHYDHLMGNKKEQLFYERILPRVRERNVEELESRFENILLEEQFEILGFFGPGTQYRMEYRLENKPRLFIGKRILWDPIGSFAQMRHFVFSRREFFVDEEMLRRLYITYGVRRERERSLSSHRIKRFFLCRGYNKDLINKLSIRWWNQLPMDQKQNIYTLKHIEKIGIRLKRPQIFTPVYLYQRWLIENIPGKFSRPDLLNHKDRWININKLLLDDSFTYNIILESYQYLFEFFSSNKLLLNRMTKTLLIKKWIFQNEIGDIIHNDKKMDVENK